ncbi:histidine kinase [Paenibacillus sp. 1P07SE]|uniref:sensor histidine kinase n=1 Tax=Paenibacillus sp. 1P07SE TaxID=3132209 RepID=UPI0039A784EE
MKILRGLWKRSTLFSKLLLVLIVTVSLPIAVLGYVSYERSKDQIEEVARAFLTDNVNQNRQRVERLLREAEQRSEAVIGSEELQALLRRPAPRLVTDELEFIQRMNGLITELRGPYELYVFPQAYERYPNYNNLMQYRQVNPSEAMFEEAARLAGRGYWTHEWNEQWKAPDYIYVRQVRSLDRFEPVGVLAIRIPHFMIRAELIGPTLYPQAGLMITDAEGAVLSHPVAEEYGMLSAIHRDQGAYLYASEELSAEGWQLSIILPRDVITASLGEVQRFTLWIVILNLILITLLLYLIVRMFTNPIKQILRYMKRVQIGQLEPITAEERHDELGQWVKGYNAMIDSLLDQIATIRQMERERQDLERQMLILQINPHFLYNTLDSIKWKLQALQEPDIAEMVTRLAGMFRFSLSDSDGWTSVERELEHVKNYVAIEQLRNPGQFRVLYHVQPELMGERMLQLLLQPLVENAIRHGMGNRQEKNGKIILSAYKAEDGDMAFTIEDNGPGGQAGKPAGGIGMSNVERRLVLHFGEAYRLAIDSSDLGFKVTIKHPASVNSLNMHP